MDPDKEKNLLVAAIAGNSDAFTVLVTAYYDFIYRTAFKWCGNQHDAEDIAQNVCIKLGRSISSFKMDSAFSSWVYRITLNATRDLQRKKKPYIEISELAKSHEDDKPAAEKRLELNNVWQFVLQLPDKLRDAVLLVYAEGLTHQQAAQVMACPANTVSWRISEAKKQLQQIMSSTTNNGDEDGRQRA